jgi:hypothetical protein
MKVEYDASMGVATSINYDGSAPVADDEVFYRVSDVHTVYVMD